MSTYDYKARDKSGDLVSSVIDGDSKADVAAKLKQAGYLPIEIKEAKKIFKVSDFIPGLNKVKISELNIFTRQLFVLQKAGMNILTSLKILSADIRNKKLKDTLLQVIKDIEAGKSLSSAMEKCPDVFDALYVNMIRAGETSGALDECLEKVADLGEYEEKMQLRIKSATRYPILVLASILIAFLGLTIFIIPRFSKIYEQFTAKLPWPTQVLMIINSMLTKYWLITLIVTGVAGYILHRVINTKQGRLFWDGLKLKVPVFGPLTLKLAMARFTYLLGSLLTRGVPLFDILNLSAKGAGNVIISGTIDKLKKSVNKGKGISVPMQESGMFPSIVVQMTYLGEQTGKLDELLLYVSSYYESQADYMINNLTTLIEPILIFILGGMVLFMALGIFLPMWNLMSLFKG